METVEISPTEPAWVDHFLNEIAIAVDRQVKKFFLKETFYGPVTWRRKKYLEEVPVV
jgi:hypothetical protein